MNQGECGGGGREVAHEFGGWIPHDGGNRASSGVGIPHGGSDRASGSIGTRLVVSIVLFVVVACCVQFSRDSTDTTPQHTTITYAAQHKKHQHHNTQPQHMLHNTKKPTP